MPSIDTKGGLHNRTTSLEGAGNSDVMPAWTTSKALVGSDSHGTNGDLQACATWLTLTWSSDLSLGQFTAYRVTSCIQDDQLLRFADWPSLAIGGPCRQGWSYR